MRKQTACLAATSALLMGCLSPRAKVARSSEAAEPRAEAAEASEAPGALSNAEASNQTPPGAPSPPSTPIATSDGGAPDGGSSIGGLSAEQVRTVVMTKVESFQGCYEVALAKDLDAQGGVTIAFVIGTDGTVDVASVASSEIRTENCTTF